MSTQGYVRFPHLFQDRLVFVAEDDLWQVESDGGRAERLTAGVGEVSYPRFSPDGQWLAFVGREEGPSEVYIMPAIGEPARRLTFHAGRCRVLGWTPDSQEILYASDAGQFTSRFDVIYAIKISGGLPRQLPYGLANAISYGPDGAVVIGRNIGDIARWKRYRGGTAGHIWCDREGNGNFKRLSHLQGNIADPCWVGERIYFLSDYEGIGNLYSSTPHGEEIRRHTNHQDFYARNLSSDGQRLVYHAGADLYLFDPTTSETHHVPVELPSIRTQRNRKFVSASSYMDTYALHPQGHKLALTTRGKAFALGNWEGPVLQLGELDGVRYRFLEWLKDGKRMITISDAPGRETLIIFSPEDATEPRLLKEIELGRVDHLAVSPTDDKVAITNHRSELILVDLETESARILDRSKAERIAGIAWSPDGRWLAYGFPLSLRQTAIKLCNLETGETHQVTEPILRDFNPAFDPEGKYLYFIGQRIFKPSYDTLQFDLHFPRGTKPYAVMLRRDQRSPFIAEPKAPDEDEKKKDKSPKENGTDEKKEGSQNGQGSENKENGKEKDANEKPEPLVIDLEGITERVLPFPVNEGRFSSILGIKGKAIFHSYAQEPANSNPFDNDGPKGTLEYYDFKEYKVDTLLSGANNFTLSRNNKVLLYRSHHRLRALKAGEKPKVENDKSGRESGWIDLYRVKVSVNPSSEWRQMFAEAWRLQREQFWTEDMSGVDWAAIYAQYAPLVERVSSRAELSDLLWELQGELGTSHAYELGGEYRSRPHYHQGNLGVDWSYDEEQQRYRITRIVKGDTANSNETSPLTTPGLNVKLGDTVLAINGQRVTAELSPMQLLVNQAHQEVQLTIEESETQEVRSLVVKTLGSDTSARYREWVESNRKYVHEVSQGQVGYIHIPNMMGQGFAEFYRGFLVEYDYPALLVDVRWNGGGHVSSRLLETLARRRFAYVFARWSETIPYPEESPRGPMVALTNEQAGSDGDIFSHTFKLMGLGPLIGMRTWGGVVGIEARHRLVDGTLTTQPEFSFWFKDVGWNVENYGTDPDIEIDIAPQDFAANADPQLDRAIAEALHLIKEQPAFEPSPGERPHLGRPR